MAMHSADQAAPAREWLAVVPSDTADLPAGCRGLYVGGAGNVSLLGAKSSPDNVPLVFTGVTVGTVLPVGPRRVFATGTTATLLIALY